MLQSLITFAFVRFLKDPVRFSLGSFILMLVYLISPIDLLPDFFPGVGRIDDLAVIIFWGATMVVLHQARKKILHDLRAGRRKGTTRNRHQSRQQQGPQRNNQPRQPKHNPHEILGVKPDCSLNDLKRAYKRQLALYHPDKLSHLGGEFAELATRKTHEIMEAYKSLAAQKQEKPKA